MVTERYQKGIRKVSERNKMMGRNLRLGPSKKSPEELTPGLV